MGTGNSVIGSWYASLFDYINTNFLDMAVDSRLALEVLVEFLSTGWFTRYSWRPAQGNVTRVSVFDRNASWLCCSGY